MGSIGIDMGCKIVFRLIVAGCLCAGALPGWADCSDGAGSVGSITNLPALSAPASSSDGSYTVSNVTDSLCERKQNANGSWPAWTEISYAGGSKGFAGKTNAVYQYMTFRSAGPTGCVTNYMPPYPSFCYSSTSPITNIAVVQEPGMPAAISFTSPDISGNYTVSWSVVSGANNYLLEERKRNADGSWGGWSNVYQDSGLSKNFSGKAQSSTWQYQVSAYYAIGGHSSSYSEARQSSNVNVRPRHCRHRPHRHRLPRLRRPATVCTRFLGALRPVPIAMYCKSA
jgi:hypothetical protein